MAVRPWENRFIDVKVHDVGSSEAKTGTKMQIKPSDIKPMPTATSNIQNHKVGPSRSDGSGCSSAKSAGFLSTSAMSSDKSKPKTLSEEGTTEADQKLSGMSLRSHSNPKERLIHQNSDAKKQLSLPSGDGHSPQKSFLGTARSGARECLSPVDRHPSNIEFQA